VVVDPGQASEVEVALCAGDRDVGEAGFGVVDRAGQGVAVGVGFVGVEGFGEVR
jgi:hypothetical protein